MAAILAKAPSELLEKKGGWCFLCLEMRIQISHTGVRVGRFVLFLDVRISRPCATETLKVLA